MFESSEPSTACVSNAARLSITAQRRQISEVDRQRLNALELGNARRFERAEIKKRLKAGEIDLDELLDEIPPCLAKVPIVKILTWVPRAGDSTAKRWVAILELKSGEDTLTSMPAVAKYRLSEMVHEFLGE